MYMRNLERDFARAKKEHANWPMVVSEGDSWFSVSNVIGRLDGSGYKPPQQQRPWALLRCEKAGDEILSILSGAQRSNLRAIFRGYPIDALLFSGGGNDIIGPDLLPLLNQYTKQDENAQTTDVIIEKRYKRRLRQIQDCYRELLDLLADAGRQNTKVFVHSYDYIVPSNRPFKLLGVLKLAGPWVSRYFEQRNIPKGLHADVVKFLIDGFVNAIDEVADESSGRLVRVETRGLVIDDWRDEIHPNAKGARRIAAAFEAALLKEKVLSKLS